MNKKRILLVQNRLSYGGTTTLIMFIVKNLSSSYIFDLFCFEKNDHSIENDFIRYGGKIIHEPKLFTKNTIFGKIKRYYFKASGLMTLTIKKKLKGTDYHAIHCFEESESGYYLKAAFQSGICMRIIHFCTDNSRYLNLSFFRMFIINRGFGLIDKYATDIIGFPIKTIPTYFSREDNRVALIKNPINDKFYIKNNNVKHLSLVQVGRFSYNKNQMFTLKVLKCIKDILNDDSVILNLVGYAVQSEKDYFDEMINYIDKNKLTANVVFNKPDCDLNDLLSRSSFLLLPSFSEGFGIVLIEAQAAGVTCYSSLAAADEANLGGVIFLELSNGPESWAQSIVDDYSKNKGIKKTFNIDSYRSQNVIKDYKKLYE